jgi:hypothetical protein
MWVLAIVAGVAAAGLAGWLARRLSLAGRTTLSGLTDLVRWPLFGASLWVAFGLARHQAAAPLAWIAVIVIGGGLAGQAAYLAGYTVWRLRRGTPPDGRGDAVPPAGD